MQVQRLNRVYVGILAHSMANPLTAKYGTIHGIAVGLALPLVIKFNMEETECCKTYANFARVSGLSKDNCSEMEGAEILSIVLKIFYPYPKYRLIRMVWISKKVPFLNSLPQPLSNGQLALILAPFRL